LLQFPFDVYQNFLREHAYGLATQTFPSWLGDQLKAFVVALVGNIIFLPILYAVFRRAPRLWWAFGTGLAILFIVVGTMVTPVFIAPIFNKYQPLTDPKIRDPILAAAR